MTAGIIFLLGLLAVWLGVTGRGKTMWEAISRNAPNRGSGGSHLQ